MKISWNRPDPNSFASAIRLNRMLAVMDDSAREHIYDHMREIECEVRIQQAVDRQLEADLQADIYRDHKDGTQSSPFYQMLPLEVRSQVFAYVVGVEQSVHVFPPKGNESHGFRLSLCDESSYDFELGSCRCDDSRAGRSIQSEFFNNALFLVSQTVRREALDAFFITNRFTFTCLYELVRFTATFTQSCSKIQHLRVFERVDDYPASDFRLESIQNARSRLKGLKRLELYVFLASWSAYEELYEDGLVDQLVHFALGPPPLGMPSKKRKLADLEEHDDEDLNTSERNSQEATKSKTLQTDNPQANTGNLPLRSAQINQSNSGENCTSRSNVTQTSDSGYSSEASHNSNNCRSDRTGIIPNPVHLTVLEQAKRQAVQSHTSPRSSISSTLAKPLPEFSIPPLKSFASHIRLRTQYLTMRLNRNATDPKQSYYEDLYRRLDAHLTDIYMDAGRRYRTIEDVPKLGDKPKVKIREDEKPLRGTEKRGILFMKD